MPREGQLRLNDVTKDREVYKDGRWVPDVGPEQSDSERSSVSTGSNPRGSTGEGGHEGDGSPFGRILAVFLIIGLVIGGGFLLSNLDFDSLIPEAVESGTLQITSNPSGLTVLVDGKSSGITPLYLTDITPGTHSVSLVNGISQNVVVTKGKVTTVNLVGSESEKTSGGAITIMIKPDVPARIYLDGMYQGVTTNDEPLTVTGISNGQHKILVRADGYADLEYPFSIRNGQKQTVSLALSWW